MADKRTDKQIDASRRNGAKSKGPVTAEGRARSSQNAYKHGFAAKRLVLPHEDPAKLEAHVAAYVQRFAPIDKVEYDLVEQLALAAWRLARIPFYEAGMVKRMIENENIRREDGSDK